MKTCYERPEAELIDFAAREALAIVTKSEDGPSEDLGDDPTIGFISKDF